MPRKIGLVLLAGFVAVLGDPLLARSQEPQRSLGKVSVLSSTIGDFDCFGYGAPGRKLVNPGSPCGTLPGPPIADVSDAPGTDVLVDCSQGNALTFTHTLDIPSGATVLGGTAVINIGGIQKSLFNTVVTADGVPALDVPDTGEFGTALIAIPLTKAATTLLDDGQVVVTVRHGISGPIPKCDPIFVDFSTVSVLVRLAP
jgi:hypothetical protein